MASMLRFAVLFATLCIAQPASAAEPSRPHPTLRGVECLNPNMARAWLNSGDRHLLVDAGRYKYRIEVSKACTSLDDSQAIAFRPDPVAGRVCGGLGEAILTRDYPCPIRGMELLSPEQYKQAVDQELGERRARKQVRKPKAS